MKFRLIGSTTILSAMLMAACVSASEKVTDANTVDSQNKEPVVIAANQVTVGGGEVRELDEDGFPIPKQRKKLGKAPPPPKDAVPPLKRLESAPIGTLKNPYKHELSSMAKWGKKAYLGNSCNGCHGGSGGGGMCPPLSNSTWVYGKDDDTLFRLITLGSDEYMKKYSKTRKGRENVVGPMPPYGNIIKTDDEIWRIISFIRTIYNGDPKDDPRNVH